MKKIRLVENNLGAAYTDNYLFFKSEEISHFVERTNRRAFSDSKKYPDVTAIYFKHSTEPFLVRSNDFFEVTK